MNVLLNILLFYIFFYLITQYYEPLQSFFANFNFKKIWDLNDVHSTPVKRKNSEDIIK